MGERKRVSIKRAIHQSPGGAGQIKAHKRASLLGAALLSQPPSSFHITSPALSFSLPSFLLLTVSGTHTRAQYPAPLPGENYTHKTLRNPAPRLICPHDNVHGHSLIHSTPSRKHTRALARFTYCVLIDCYSGGWEHFITVWCSWLEHLWTVARASVFASSFLRTLCYCQIRMWSVQLNGN